MSAQLKDKIDNWLHEIGHTPLPQDDPTAEYHVVVNCPAGTTHQVHVVVPVNQSDRVVIASGSEISHEHREAFDKLDDDGKEAFLWDFRFSINNVHADFKLDGVKGALDCPSRFQVTAVRFDDGLTKDSLAQSLGAVIKTELAAVWTIQRHLSPRSFGSGGRFDFKRLGL